MGAVFPITRFVRLGFHLAHVIAAQGCDAAASHRDNVKLSEFRVAWYFTGDGEILIGYPSPANLRASLSRFIHKYNGRLQVQGERVCAKRLCNDRNQVCNSPFNKGCRPHHETSGEGLCSKGL